MFQVFMRIMRVLLITVGCLCAFIGIGAWSMPRNEILFMRYQRTDVDVVRLDVLHRLTVNMTRREGYDGTPTWSPDGRLIAFTSDRSGPLSVYVMDSRGKQVRSVIPVQDGAAFSSRWSADGQRLYFFRIIAGREDIFQVNLDGSNFRQVTDVDARNSIRQELDIDPLHLNSTVSPDGRYYLYVMYREGEWGIYISEGAGGEPEHLADAGQQYTDTPAWSGDGHQVTFVALTEGGYDLFRVPAQPGATAEQLTRDTAQESYPSWRP